MRSNAKAKGRGILFAGLAVAVAAGAAGLLHPDLMLSRGFDRALEAPGSDLSFGAATARGQPQTATPGDEGYWLTRSEVESQAPFAKPLAIGDRITIGGRDGRERRLEVMDLKAIGDPVRAGTVPLRMTLVTCRVTDDAGGQTDAVVRFIVEAEPAETTIPAPAKSL